MPIIERICPECGASNSFAQRSCLKCHTPLTGLPVLQNPRPSPFSRRGIAKLAWRATKFLTRAGFDLARRGAEGGLERIQQRGKQDVKNETIDADYRLRDWRVWSAPSEKTEQAKPHRVNWGSKK